MEEMGVSVFQIMMRAAPPRATKMGAPKTMERTRRIMAIQMREGGGAWINQEEIPMRAARAKARRRVFAFEEERHKIR